MILKKLIRITIDAVTSQLPLLLLSFFFLNPIWIGMLKHEPVGALKSLFFVDNIVSCDLYTALCCAFVLALCVGLLPRMLKIPVKVLVYAVLIVSFVVKKFLFNELQIGITSDVLNLVLETTPNESAGFFETYLNNAAGLKYALLFLLCILLSALAEWIYAQYLKRRIHAHRLTRRLLAVGVPLAAVLWAVSQKHYFKLEGYTECNTYTSVRAAYKRAMDSRQESVKFWDNMRRIDAETDVAVCDEDSINVIFVLGESFQKAHSSLYGYYLPTMPHSMEEQQMGNLYKLDDLITPYSLTTPTMHSVMCLNSIAEGEPWYEGAFFPQLFRKAGFDVYFWDSFKDEAYRLNNSFYEIYTAEATEMWMTDENHNYFANDYDYAEDFLATVKLRSSRNLIVFHQTGSHFPYNDKYTPAEARFSSKDIRNSAPYMTEEKRRLVAEYDNSIIHTDCTLKLLYDAFRNTNAVLVFLSDHGDEVYDYRDCAVRPPMDDSYKAEYMHALHDVPSFVWCSDRYKQQHPQLVAQLERAVAKPGVSDKIGYLMLTLGGVKSKYYNKQRDMLSDDYKTPRREVYFNSFNAKAHRVVAGGNGLDYDSIVSGK